MKNLLLMFLFASVMILSGCSGEQEDTGGGDHVWKGQTDTMDKAKEVESMVMDQADEMRKTIEKQTK
jgi:protein involved in sex pheromone biosynthesis